MSSKYQNAPCAFLLMASAVLHLPVMAAQAEDFNTLGSNAIVMTFGNSSVDITTSATATVSISSIQGCNTNLTSGSENGVLRILANDLTEECHFVATLPENFPQVVVESANGAISFQGSVRNLQLDGANGSVVARLGILESLVISSSNGAIAIDQVQSQSTTIDSANGNVSVNRLSSPFSIGATNGIVLVRRSTVPYRSKSAIKKTNGKVAVRNVRVRAPKGQKKARLKLKTYSVNGTINVRGSHLPSRRSNVTTLGNGHASATLSIRTVNADIVVK